METKRLVDLSHLIEAGMTTYKGLPGPQICDYWTREHRPQFYDDGASFQIGRIDMVANTGTYLDAPFHRFAQGDDLGALEPRAARLPARPRRPAANMAVGRGRVRGPRRRRQGGAGPHRLGPALAHRSLFSGPSLPHRGGGAAARRARREAGRHRQPQYRRHRGRARPVHTVLLGAGILICEHMTNLGALPDDGFAFTAVPPKIAGMGTFPVRAFATVG